MVAEKPHSINANGQRCRNSVLICDHKLEMKITQAATCKQACPNHGITLECSSHKQREVTVSYHPAVSTHEASKVWLFLNEHEQRRDHI